MMATSMPVRSFPTGEENLALAEKRPILVKLLTSTMNEQWVIWVVNYVADGCFQSRADVR